MNDGVVLICDDNISVHKSLDRYLREYGMLPVSAFSGEEALKLMRERHIDIVVLDVMLPGMSGIDFLRELRRKSSVAVIMLSAKDSELDRVIGLELGADDYVTKPFSPREVSLRVKKLLARYRGVWEPRRLSFFELSIIVDSYEVYVNGKRIDLTPKEVELLSCLVDNAGKVLSREMLLNAVWGVDYTGDVRCVDTQIKRLRQKLPAENVSFAIRSVYGVGYKLEALR